MKNSLILIIDTAHPTARIILVDDEKILGTREWVNTPKVGTDLLVYSDELLKECECVKSSLTRIAVHTGPGSYGLVRTGIITATMLAQALGAQMVEVNGETAEELVETAQKAIPTAFLEARYRT